ncbi:hypothetical protein TNCV_2066661 [Trichonephila clavipes]|uniref:Uncharacterized protein n=1 Tax=Trichonephila clavipes TaxID=2585209 RepID=A0A8X7BCW1_TRICX|nr:hypothetical protein TNCV_2066661 [Trichonephila clavipes]
MEERATVAKWSRYQIMAGMSEFQPITTKDPPCREESASMIFYELRTNSVISWSAIIEAVPTILSSTAINSSVNTIEQSNLVGVFRIWLIPRRESFSC